MTEHPTLQELEAYAYDAVDPSRQAPIHDHVADCAECRHTVGLEREERKTLVCALEPEPLGFPAIPARDRSARMLAAAGAAVVLISALWWAIPGTPRVPGDPRSGEVEWRYPVEVSEVRNSRQGLRAVFRTPEGVCGVLFDRTLFYSKGGVRPWTQIQGIAGTTSPLLVEGEAARYLAWEGELLDLRTVSFGGATRMSADPLPWPEPLRRVRVHALELAARENLKFALVESSDGNGPGTLHVSRSQDSGKTWDAFREIARGTLKSAQHGLLATAEGAVAYYVTDAGTLACVQSADGGATWAPMALSIPGTLHRVLDYVRAVSVQGKVHLVYSAPEPGKQAALVHLSSGDGGRSWSEPVRIASLDRVGVSFETRDQFQVRAIGDALVCSVGAGIQAGQNGRLLVSRDAGKSWRDEEEAFGGLRSAPRAALSWRGPQGILLGLHVTLPEGVEYLLLRETGAPPAPTDAAPATPWWKRAGK